MKTYQIELKRVSYVNLTIEAESQDEAEEAAWLELQTGDFDCNNAQWDIEFIEELDEPATDDSRSYGPHHQDDDQFYGPSARI